MPATGRRVFTNGEISEQTKRALSGFEIVGPEADDAALGTCVGALVWAHRLPRETWVKLTGVRAVQTFSAGVDGVRFDLLPPATAVLSNAGAYADPVGEHAWSILLGAAKGLHVRKQRTTTRLLRGGILLVVGCGGIGSEVARLARASLSMKTLGVSRTFRHPEYFDERHQAPDLPSVIGRADAIVLALPLTSRTRSILNYDLLARTKETVVIANVGRGDSVDEDSMFRILTERPETRYATDVFWDRDGKESFETMLWDLPNFSGTFHTAGVSGGAEFLAGVREKAARNLALYLKEGKAANVVDRSEYEK